MKIVIMGAGAVGTYLAERLSFEGQEVIIVEVDEARAAEVQRHLDARVIIGNGASPTVLREHSLDDSDLMIAVSDSDGANVLACHVAADLGVKRTVARVEDPEMREALTGLEVDFVIDPGETGAHELVALVRQSGVSEMVEFGDGALVLVGATVSSQAGMVGRPLASLVAEHSQAPWVVVALVRNGATTVAHGHTVIEGGDHVLMMVEANFVTHAARLMGVRTHRIERVVVFGSTRLAELTIRDLLEAGFDTVLIDSSADRCRVIAEEHPDSLVMCSDPTDPEVISSLNLDSRDAVLALTGWDEVNLLTCLLAKAHGAATTVARFNRIEYVSLLAGVGIDAAVSSRLIAASEILRFVRRGRVHSVTAFSDTAAEAIEIEVEKSSKAVGLSLLELEMPPGAVVGGFIRDEEAFVPTGRTEIMVGDRLIIFSLPECFSTVESLFAKS